MESTTQDSSQQKSSWSEVSWPLKNVIIPPCFDVPILRFEFGQWNSDVGRPPLNSFHMLIMFWLYLLVLLLYFHPSNYRSISSSIESTIFFSFQGVLIFSVLRHPLPLQLPEDRKKSDRFTKVLRTVDATLTICIHHGNHHYPYPVLNEPLPYLHYIYTYTFFTKIGTKTQPELLLNHNTKSTLTRLFTKLTMYQSE